MSSTGFVYLVGAGPWDPGLLTLRGREVLGRADVVVADYLVNPELLAFAPAAAERIAVRAGGMKAQWDWNFAPSWIHRSRIVVCSLVKGR